MFKRSVRAACLSAWLVVVLLGCEGKAQQAVPVRPKITGISHVGYFVSDLPKALLFWHDLLGFEVAYSLPRTDGSGVRIALLKINDHQHVELFNEPSTHPPSMMSHLCFAVDDVEAMRAYLRAKGSM